MWHELLIVLATFSFYFKNNEGRWVARILGIVFPILILKLVPALDKRVRLFIMAVLAWNLVDFLNIAIGEPKKNTELVHRYANPTSDASSVDARVGSVTPEVSRECGEAQDFEPEMGTQDLE
jgi:hypothetical protein